MSKPMSPCDFLAGLARGSRTVTPIVAALLALLSGGRLMAEPTDLSSVPLPTLTVKSEAEVMPNIMMVLDDSGSMAWDYLPDWAGDWTETWWGRSAQFPDNYSEQPPYYFYNAAFNGVAYNPAVRYSPPIKFTEADGKVVFPEQNGMTAAGGADTGHSLPNWRKVKDDAFHVQATSTSTTNLTGKAIYYTAAAGEYCDSPSLTNCKTSNGPDGKFAYPALLRWCDSAKLTNCRGLRDDSTYKYPRFPAPWSATITFSISGSTNSRVNSVTIGGKKIMSGRTDETKQQNTLASWVAERINNCSGSTTGDCQVSGYWAASSSNTVYIYGWGKPSGTVGWEGTSKVSATTASFGPSKVPEYKYLASGKSQSDKVVPGAIYRVDVVSGGQYAYPGTAEKAAGRTDCAGSTCTYGEEMTNYANWYTYYRTRMQMMKTATSRAFAALDSDEDIAANKTRYRVGFLTINDYDTDQTSPSRSNRTDFVNIDDFTLSQKSNWFSKLFNAKPQGGTPLRHALSIAGRIYAGKMNGQTFRGSKVTDPLQFSCQKNYTILSTDGYWNGEAGKKLDGTTLNLSYDSHLPRPYNDGGTPGTMSERTSQLQKRTGQLQERTRGRYGWGNWTKVSSCTPVYNSRECRVNANWEDTGSCTASSNSSGWTTECQYTEWTSWTPSPSCVSLAQSSGPKVFSVGTATECDIAGGKDGPKGTLADVAAYYYQTDLRDPDAAKGTGTCDSQFVDAAGKVTATNVCENNVVAYGRDNSPQQHMTTHTLGLGAQGKMVYSQHQNDASGDRVFAPDYWAQPSGDFHSVATGANANGSSICPWMSSGSCTWPTPGTITNGDAANIDDLWHAAVNGRGTYFSASDPSSLSSAFTNVLGQILAVPRPGTAAAAASSNPNITSSDNYVFSSSYRSVDWIGELIMQKFEKDGTLSKQKWSAMQMLDCAATPWQPNKAYEVQQTYKVGSTCYNVKKGYTSGASFDAAVDGANSVILPSGPVTRKILTPRGSSLVSFSWLALSTTQKSYFELDHIKYQSAAQGLSQFCDLAAGCLSEGLQTNAAGENLVKYLAGDRTHEGTYYRARSHVLGDIVSSEARYVKQPMQTYQDAGYADYKVAKASRAPTVYVGSNDGMLHAFDADTGQERWAFIPSAVLPDLYRLADIDYANKHRYFVDGTPEVGDICPKASCTGDEWRTIIVGGLNQGGKAFYALDITDPADPKLLWEKSSAELPTLGFSYSNPRITKMGDTWVVIVASGYNNSDGVGRLYVIDAGDGDVLKTISTGVGDNALPSGLTKLAARAPTSATNNTVQQVYGGDLLGNVWRFDVNDATGVAYRLVTLKDPDGGLQPITAKPTVASVNSSPLIMVGTGRYLGETDLDDTEIQSVYAIKDKLDGVALTSPRDAGSKFVQQVLKDEKCPADAPASICDEGQTVRTVTEKPVDWGVHNGWFIDFLLKGERSVTDPSLALGTLVFTTIKPQSETGSTIMGCAGTEQGVTATSYLYYLNYLTGGAVEGTGGVVGEELCTCIATRPSVVKTQNGNVEGIIRMSGGGVPEGTDMGVTRRENLPYSSAGGPTRRISWRELVSD